MTDPSARFHINLNQNLWALIVALAGLAAGEYLGLRYIRYLSLVLACLLSVSVLVTTYFYTVEYRARKSRKAEDDEKG